MNCSKLLMGIVFFVMPYISSFGQEKNSNRTNQLFELTGTVGASQGTGAVAYLHNWQLGSKGRFEIGLGGRWTTYVGTKKDFITAGPARYTRSFTFPFLIFFAGQQEQHFDTLTLQRPLQHAINLMVNLGYRFHPKWYAGFNIDLIGFGFGRKTSGIFTSNGTTQLDPAAKPAKFNLLLTGDHDRGSLNSEFYLRYQLTARWQLKALYQFVFIEYKTNSVQQFFDDGKSNDRFRNKANNLGLGIVYFIHQ